MIWKVIGALAGRTRRGKFGNGTFLKIKSVIGAVVARHFQVVRLLGTFDGSAAGPAAHTFRSKQFRSEFEAVALGPEEIVKSSDILPKSAEYQIRAVFRPGRPRIYFLTLLVWIFRILARIPKYKLTGPQAILSRLALGVVRGILLGRYQFAGLFRDAFDPGL